MKRMLLTLEILTDDDMETDFEQLDEVLEEQGFVSAVENDEGTLTMLPLGSYYGEFDANLSANSLVDKVEKALAANDFEANALLITEMGEDMVLIGEEVTEEDEDEEPEAKA